MQIAVFKDIIIIITKAAKAYRDFPQKHSQRKMQSLIIFIIKQKQ